MKRYALYEVFLTLQGEGMYTGTRAVFARFAGCNVWSGQPEHRERDTAKGCCAAWCDTEFRGTGGPRGGVYTAPELALLIVALWDRPEAPTLVCTGGEPALQVDAELVDVLHAHRVHVHIETNGSKPLPTNLDWVTLSPKPPMPVLDQHYDEVKVIYPAGIDPAEYARHSLHRFVQPMHPATGGVADRDIRRRDHTKKAIEFVMKNPGWRLGVQLHKDVGLP